MRVEFCCFACGYPVLPTQLVEVIILFILSFVEPLVEDQLTKYMRTDLWAPYSAPLVYAAKSLQSCPTLCDPRDSSPPGSPIPGIFQVRRLEWVAISFPSAWKWKVKVKLLSRVRLFSNPMDCSLPGSSIHGIFWQEYWSGVPLPSPLVYMSVFIPILYGSSTVAL